MNIIILVLGMLSAFGPLSIDMYLPALPKIASDFGVQLSSVQMSLASFFIGISLGQIIYGPVTDQFGRKRPLYFGLTLYALASFLCAVSSSVDQLIYFRFLQAIGACAGMVICRAIVRDLYRPHESAKIFSMLMLIMGIAPILAPVLGGALSAAFGWRGIFWVLTGMSLLALGAVFFFLKETHAPDGESKLQRAFHNYAEILKDQQFVGYTFSSAFFYAGMFAYITGSSFVFIEHFKLDPGTYAWIFGLNAAGLILFSQVNGRLLRKHSPQKLTHIILPFSFGAGVLILLEGLFNGPLWVMCTVLFLYILTLGGISPNAAACALAGQKRLAGSASALMGTIQFGISAIGSGLVSSFHNGTILPMCVGMFACATLSYAIYRVLVHGQRLKWEQATSFE